MLKVPSDNHKEFRKARSTVYKVFQVVSFIPTTSEMLILYFGINIYYYILNIIYRRRATAPPSSTSSTFCHCRTRSTTFSSNSSSANPFSFPFLMRFNRELYNVSIGLVWELLEGRGDWRGDPRRLWPSRWQGNYPPPSFPSQPFRNVDIHVIFNMYLILVVLFFRPRSSGFRWRGTRLTLPLYALPLSPCLSRLPFLFPSFSFSFPFSLIFSLLSACCWRCEGPRHLHPDAHRARLLWQVTIFFFGLFFLFLFLFLLSLFPFQYDHNAIILLYVLLL